MSVVSDVANQFVDYFNLQDTVNGAYEAVEGYYSTPEKLSEAFAKKGQIYFWPRK